MCRLRSIIPSASKRLSQYSLFFTLSLGVILLHQKKKPSKNSFSRTPCRTRTYKPKMVPELESGVSTNSTNGA